MSNPKTYGESCDDLNNAIRSVEMSLTARRFLVPACIKLGVELGAKELWFKRFGGDWHLVLRDPTKSETDAEQALLNNCSIQQRIECLTPSNLSALVGALETAANTLQGKIETTTQGIHRFLADFRSNLP